MEKVCIKFERNFFMVVFVYDFYFFEWRIIVEEYEEIFNVNFMVKVYL